VSPRRAGARFCSTPRPEGLEGPEARDRRRRARFLGGARSEVYPLDHAPEVLDAQDIECAQLPAASHEAQGEGRPAPDLDGRGSSSRPRTAMALFEEKYSAKYPTSRSTVC
jgi:hypothetical protein